MLWVYFLLLSPGVEEVFLCSIPYKFGGASGDKIYGNVRGPIRLISQEFLISQAYVLSVSDSLTNC